MHINRQIINFLKSQYVDYMGFADLKNYQNELKTFGGRIVQNYKSGITFGLVIPDSIADFLPGRDDNNIACEYKTHGYTVLNRRLDYIASVLASLLNSKGYRTLPIPAAQRSDIDNAIPPVSHKMIAHIAGLGWIGKNCLLITEKHGPRVRFSSLLTNAPLKTKNSPMEQKCGTCMKCVKACPAEAIKGRNYIAGESREKRLDFKKCWEYFDMLKKTKDFDVCGMCLYVCPYGKNDKN